MIHKTKNKPNKKKNQTTTQKTKQTKRNKEGLGPSEVARKKKTTNPTCPQQKHMFVKIWARNPKRVLMKFWHFCPHKGKKQCFCTYTNKIWIFALFQSTSDQNCSNLSLALSHQTSKHLLFHLDFSSLFLFLVCLVDQLCRSLIFFWWELLKLLMPKGGFSCGKNGKKKRVKQRDAGVCSIKSEMR